MRRAALLLPLFVILSVTPIAAAEKDWTISVHGGASVPTGDFAAANKGDAQAGWQVGGTMDYLWSERWAFGVDGGWNQNAHGAEGAVFDLGGGNTRTVDRDRLTTWQFGAHAACFLPTRPSLPVKWYAQAGGGLYGLTEKVTETVQIGGTATTLERTVPDKRGGLMFGLGGTWWANTQVGISAGLDYHVAFFDRDRSRSATLSYGVIHAGVTFIAPKSPTADF
jgi:hypothetical protein